MSNNFFSLLEFEILYEYYSTITNISLCIFLEFISVLNIIIYKYNLLKYKSNNETNKINIILTNLQLKIDDLNTQIQDYNTNLQQNIDGKQLQIYNTNLQENIDNKELQIYNTQLNIELKNDLMCINYMQVVLPFIKNILIGLTNPNPNQELIGLPSPNQELIGLPKPKSSIGGAVAIPPNPLGPIVALREVYSSKIGPIYFLVDKGKKIVSFLNTNGEFLNADANNFIYLYLIEKYKLKNYLSVCSNSKIQTDILENIERIINENENNYNFNDNSKDPHYEINNNKNDKWFHFTNHSTKWYLEQLAANLKNNINFLTILDIQCKSIYKYNENSNYKNKYLRIIINLLYPYNENLKFTNEVNSYSTNLAAVSTGVGMVSTLPAWIGVGLLIPGPVQAVAATAASVYGAISITSSLLKYKQEMSMQPEKRKQLSRIIEQYDLNTYNFYTELNFNRVIGTSNDNSKILLSIKKTLDDLTFTIKYENNYYTKERYQNDYKQLLDFKDNILYYGIEKLKKDYEDHNDKSSLEIIPEYDI